MIGQGRSRGRAEAWRPWIATRRRPALAWPQGLTDFARRAAQRIQEWTAAEVAPGRLVPWLAIAFGCGTIIYFAAEREPAPWAAAVLFGAAMLAAVLCRHRPFCVSDNRGCCRRGGRVCNCDGQARDHRPSGALGPGMERRARRVRRGAGRARALRSYCRSPRAR